MVLEPFWFVGPPTTATGWQTSVRWTPSGRPEGFLGDPIFDIFNDFSAFVSNLLFQTAVLKDSRFHFHGFGAVWGIIVLVFLMSCQGVQK